MNDTNKKTLHKFKLAWMGGIIVIVAIVVVSVVSMAGWFSSQDNDDPPPLESNSIQPVLEKVEDLPTEDQIVDIDYARAYYNYLVRISYGAGFDWMEAQLADLNQDGVPELVAAYGNNDTMLHERAYFEGDQEPRLTAEVNLFYYEKGNITKMPNIEVYDLESASEDGELNQGKMPLRFDTGFNLQGLRGERNKRVYIKESGESTLLYVRQEYMTSQYMFEGIIAYSLSADKQLQVESSVLLSAHKDDTGIVNRYFSNETITTEEVFTRVMEEMGNGTSDFVILEMGSDGADTEGLKVYSLNAMYYSYGERLKASFLTSSIVNESDADVADTLSAAQSQFDVKRYEEARMLCEKVLQKDFNQIDALFLMAKIESMDPERLDNAIQLLHKVLTIQPDLTEAKVLEDELKQKATERQMIVDNRKLIQSYLDTGILDVRIDLVKFTATRMRNLLGEPDIEEAGVVDSGYYYYYANYLFVADIEDTETISSLDIVNFAGIVDTNGLVGEREIAGEYPGSTRNDVKTLLGEQYSEEPDRAYEISRTRLQGDKGAIVITYDKDGNVCRITLFSALRLKEMPI